MASCTTGSYELGTVSGSTQPVTLYGQTYYTQYYSEGWMYFSTSSPPGSGQYVGTKYHPPNNYLYHNGRTCSCDTTYYYRAYGFFKNNSPNWLYGGISGFKANAIEPTVGTPVLSGATSSTITVNGSVTPGTVESSVTVYVQYKKAVDSEYTQWATAVYTGASSSSQSTTEATITGLTADTSYDFRFYMDRATTSNSTTDYYGSTSAESTLSGEPTVTTDAATAITNDGATLNLTQDVNSGTTMTVYWKWGVQTPPTDSTTSTTVVTADGATDLAVTGALASTKYYHQAFITFVTPAGTPNEGSILDFTTLADPAAKAGEEEHVTEDEFTAKYGVATTLYFTIASRVSHDVFLTNASPFAAGDVLIFKDGTYSAASTNLPTQVSAGKGLYSLALTAAEMEADVVQVQIHDVAGAIFRDASLVVRTAYALSELDIDATANILTNAQTEANYDNSPTTEGTFDGGAGQNVNDIVTMACGCTVLIEAETDNVVTEFTVTATNCTGVISGTAIAQSSTDGSGTGFELTPESSNITSNRSTATSAVKLTGYGSGDGLEATGGTGVPTNAQDETSYDNSPTTEGTFTGGTGYTAADVITMSDGTAITVDTVASGVVTEFTVSNAASTSGTANGTALTQSSVAPTGGSGFTLTPESDNITLGDDIDAMLDEKHVLSFGTVASGGAAAATTFVGNSAEDDANDYFNGAVILFYAGTGAGQIRTITDYVTATNTFTLHKGLTAALSTDTDYIIIPGEDMWAIAPGAELSAVPTYADGMMEMIQFIFQRMAYKHTETATVHTMYKVDDSTALATYGVDDDGQTETKLRTEDA